MNDEEQDRNGSAGSAQRLQAHEVSMEEYNDLAKRLDVMEASVGFVLNKVRSLNLLERISRLPLFRSILSLQNLIHTINQRRTRKTIIKI